MSQAIPGGGYLPSGFVTARGVLDPLGTPVRAQSPVVAVQVSGSSLRSLPHSIRDGGVSLKSSDLSETVK